ncbi:hypothetical protein F5Y12DRAFT_789479 [Xylaria sp. FL1777]|nr:hypothetical protein F5Y12DRAFT_789479 [Xylaria sp. FL1777]
MSATYPEYNAASEIEAFFTKTSATRTMCDARALELAGGNVVPVDIQGACSYSVYAGPQLEYVVQFRLESLALKSEVTSLATKVHGSLAPRVSFEGKVGDGEQEPLYVYLMSRIRGVSHLEFILSNGSPEDSPENYTWRQTIISDIATFLAVSWKAPQPVSPEYGTHLKQAYIKDLRLLHTALPSRFQPVVQACIDSIDDILSLPMVFLHRDLGTCNLIVDKGTCRLVGVIDWAEAEVCPFGLNLHSLQFLSGKLHLRNGWSLFNNHDNLQKVFWETFQREVGTLSDHQLRSIKLARALGLLLSSGFTSRLANEPEPVPIGADERGRYNMLSLDAFLINPQTKFDGIP